MIRTRRAALAQSGNRFSLATNAQRLRGVTRQPGPLPGPDIQIDQANDCSRRTTKCEGQALLRRGRCFGPKAEPRGSEFPYSTLPIFFTAATSRALSTFTNSENSGASM